MIDIKSLKVGDKLRVIDNQDNNVFIYPFVEVGDICTFQEVSYNGKVCMICDKWKDSVWFKPEQLEYVKDKQDIVIHKSRWEEIINSVQGGYGMTDDEADFVKSVLKNNTPFEVVEDLVDLVISKDEHSHLDATHVGVQDNPCFYYRSEILKKWYCYLDYCWVECNFEYEDCFDTIEVNFLN